MGKYTALDNPIVDQTVEDHLQQIVAAIRSRLEPRAIVLRGSFSQGEGSVVVEGNHLRFLSDYEVMAITPHYGHRRWLQTVARQMTSQLEVETSISRVHPYNIERNSLGNLPIGGIARPTIAMYEVQNGGITLYGEHLLNRGPAIDPRSLDIWAGLRLMLNRMAESLDHLSSVSLDWEGLHWINKTVLSCAEALLIVHKQYHFSYAERGRRFVELAPQLEPVLARASHLPDLVRRATAFKLRPSLDLYPDSMPMTLDQVRQACDATFRYVVKKDLGVSFNSYAEFPARYLSQIRTQNKRLPSALFLQNLLLVLKFLRAQRYPPLRLITHPMQSTYQIVYSVIPLLFLEESGEVLQEVRHKLGMLIHLAPPHDERQVELAYLRRCAVQAWKDFCYGMWSAR